MYDDCGAILYSGGTTGTTKGIMLSNLNFNALGLQTIAASGYTPVAGMKMSSIMPIFHGFGLGMAFTPPRWRRRLHSWCPSSV
ncbi:MAG: AMP-binding protein [Oscillospiraceae bacterium]